MRLTRILYARLDDYSSAFSERTRTVKARLSWFALAFALFYLAFNHQNPFSPAVPVISTVVKPLPAIALAAYALLSPAPDNYSFFTALGLSFSSIGDIFLAVPSHGQQASMWFMGGMGSFGMAHICFSIAFSAKAPWALIRATPFCAIASTFLYAVWDGLNSMKIPVTGYVVLELVMGWRALARVSVQERSVVQSWGSHYIPHPEATIKEKQWLAVAGAAMFMLSDGLLAINRFKAPLNEWSDTTVMTTYWIAQALLASSADRFVVDTAGGSASAWQFED